jgi:uncharacterized membrane protein YphA (DoxX/SURF4 family)
MGQTTTLQLPRSARALLLVVARVGIAAVFLYTGAVKTLDPASFAQDIANYRVLPDALVGPSALLLPPLELAAGAGLLLRGYRAGAAVLAGAMLLVFAFAMAQARLRGIDLDCGCFGAAVGAQVSWEKVALDLGLAILCLSIVWSELRQRRTAAAEPKPETV